MTQLIIVLVIVAFAFGAASYKIYNRFFSKKDDMDCCYGCSGCDLKKKLIERQKDCLNDRKLKTKHSEKCKN
jgi:hypothetical protein